MLEDHAHSHPLTQAPCTCLCHPPRRAAHRRQALPAPATYVKVSETLQTPRLSDLSPTASEKFVPGLLVTAATENQGDGQKCVKGQDLSLLLQSRLDSVGSFPKVALPRGRS